MSRSPAYESTTAASERVAWTLDDVLTEHARFDFSRPFLPAPMLGEHLGFLAPDEQLALNHIRAHGYLCMFGLVEEFILPYVLDQARARLEAPSDERRSLLQFASEEAKHIALFERFRAIFERDFGQPLQVLGPPEAIAAHVLDHSELGVGLLILHIEWMTQRHYVNMVRDDVALEPHFASLLRHHWLEESQHARIDEWIVQRVGASLTDVERARAVDEYLALCAFLDGGLANQVEMDLDALERVTGRRFTENEREQLASTQHQAQRRTFLGAGITHPRLLRMLQHLAPTAHDAVSRVACQYR
jgi:hypothetical protein